MLCGPGEENVVFSGAENFKTRPQQTTGDVW